MPKQLNDIFFQARKIELKDQNGQSYNPRKICIEGTPFNGNVITYEIPTSGLAPKHE